MAHAAHEVERLGAIPHDMQLMLDVMLLKSLLDEQNISEVVFGQQKMQHRLLILHARQRKAKGSAFARFALRPHTPTISFDDALANSQPETRARILFLVQALEQTKNSLGILLLEANAIVAY
jgi:hypothetical protein